MSTLIWAVHHLISKDYFCIFKKKTFVSVDTGRTFAQGSQCQTPHLYLFFKLTKCAVKEMKAAGLISLARLLLCILLLISSSISHQVEAKSFYI